MPQKSAKTFKVGGEAGFGVMSAGLLFSKIASRAGYYVFNYTEYPSLIRGGHNVMQVTFSKDKVYSQYRSTDFLVALNQETLDLHAHELTDNAVVVFDLETVKDLSTLKNSKVSQIGIPLSDLVRAIEGSYIMRNNVALGAVCALMGADPQFLIDLIDAEVGKKPQVAETNHKACYAGYEFVHKNFANCITNELANLNRDLNQLIITSNESAALGAIEANLDFFAVYPMTPTSNIMHVLTPLQEQYGFVYKQPEDEISAINMAIGASYAGARSMVATSGGGFCLMTEGYGLAAMTETPLVIIEGMRGGPATGLPTWTEQGDLKFILSASHGDFLRIVLAPGDAAETFYAVHKAFNIADKYQTPVIVLLDRYMCESQYGTTAFDTSSLKIERGDISTRSFNNEEFKRYKVTESGVSTRALPGTGAFFITNSDEHDEVGFSSEDSDNRLAQHEKRNKKIKKVILEDMEEPIVYGSQHPEITVFGYGSTKGPILEALKSFSNVSYVHTLWMNPFPAEHLKKILKMSKKTVVFECDISGQFAALLTEKTLIEPNEVVLKYDGRPFYPEEIVEKLVQLGAK